MDAINYGYSMKNIPIPSIKQYKLALIQRTEQFLKCIRWAAFFFLLNISNPNDNSDDTRKFKYGFKTNKCPPPLEETKEFENDVCKMVENVKVDYFCDEFQNQLLKDVKNINSSKNLIIPGDKTSNFYEIPKQEHHQKVLNNVTKSYKKCDQEIPKQINEEAKIIATKLDIEKRTNTLTEQQCFITVKDHKDDFRTNPKFRLINPTKSELGKVSKVILEKINTQIRQITKSNQWQNTTSTIEWFKNIQNKNKCSFIIFDIAEFYPSISKELLLNSLKYAQQYVQIPKEDIDIIMHARKSLLYHDNQAWIKRHGDPNFDVTMGSFDGAEACETVRLYILSQLHSVIAKEDIGLYRDDGLGVIRDINGPKGEKSGRNSSKYLRNTI